MRYGMPDEVRFYLPPKMEDMLMKVFDYGHIENFKRQFSQIDVDSSGDISDREMRVLLRAMHVNVDEGKFKQLLRTVDLNGNGAIEFDEFCYLMYCLLGNDNNGFWKGIIPAGDASIGSDQVSSQTSCRKARRDDGGDPAAFSSNRTPEYGQSNTVGILKTIDQAAQHLQERYEDGESSFEDSEQSGTRSDLSETEREGADGKANVQLPRLSYKKMKNVLLKTWNAVYDFFSSRTVAKVKKLWILSII